MVKQIIEVCGDKIYDFINREDNFGSTPIILACVENADDRARPMRKKLIKKFIEKEVGADINVFTRRTLWGPIHWCAHYLDKASIKTLLKAGAFSFLPDHTGRLPLDIVAYKVKLFFKFIKSL